MKKNVLITIAAVLALAALWVLSPIATGQNYLNENQKASLCDAFAGEMDPAELEFYKSIGADAATAAVVDILGVRKTGDEFYVYGHERDGEFVSFKGEAYETSGGGGVFMVKIRCNGDDVKIIESYGGISTTETWAEMPLRYNLKAQLFNPEASGFGWNIMTRDLNRKIEDKLGVPVNDEYHFSAEGGIIEVSTWVDDHAEYKYREKID